MSFAITWTSSDSRIPGIRGDSMNERRRSITMPGGRLKRDSFGYPYLATAGASTGNVRTLLDNKIIWISILIASPGFL